ncbi:exported hypothetical protein [Candidatus Sulfotelmatobacter kueseliae]|uniref:Uncharacterized protein n=1 Tax=Candidatus Sulfotelmatobacter kueseliae TaxID=2042962 RepID=A0A2U3KB84_9BACT|nr:exported hypothetical protein [Candidatus Sulfotelmatobacter kueseliae]
MRRSFKDSGAAFLGLAARTHAPVQYAAVVKKPGHSLINQLVRLYTR